MNDRSTLTHLDIVHLLIQQSLERVCHMPVPRLVCHERVYLPEPLLLYSASYVWNRFEGHRLRFSAAERPHKTLIQAAV
jgi:hypothetical protein